MKSRISLSLMRILTALALVSFVALGIAAQDDPDPNSPTPVLLSEATSTYAIAVPRKSLRRVDISRFASRPVPLYSTVVLFVTNISLMKDEGANALRVNVEDQKGRIYRFPVIAIEPYDGVKSDTPVYAVTVQVRDELGFWESPPADGDVLVGLTWRGLTSNRVKVGLNKFGGMLKDDPGAVPTPLRTTVAAKRRTFSTTSPAPNYVGYRWSGDRLRFLEQATFGPTAALDSRIRRIGLRTWLAEQFDAPYPSLTNPYPSQVLKPGNAPSDCDGDNSGLNGNLIDVPLTCFRDTYTQYQPQIWFFKEAFYGDAQLRHRVAWALAEIWVTSGVDIQQGRHIVEYHKILSNNAFGNYRNLMKEMTLSPTMGDYLSMSQSTRTNPNENYAREIMQLFTVGLFMLNQDGTVQTDANGPIPTYDQDGVNNLTKVLTGWSFCPNGNAACPNSVSGTVDFIDPMFLNVGVTTVSNNKHDLTAKTLLSYTGSTTTNIAACGNCTTLPNILTYANASLDQSMDNLFNHPNVGPFVGKRLIQQMVTSDPTPAYVSRVAAVFNNNGFGVRGDMKAVVKAILLDPEARGDVKTDPNYGKLREPVQLATNILRAFNVRSADGLSQSDGYIYARSEFSGMAQTPFLSPTVFNFYPPDYVVPNTAFVGPEFAIMNTGTAITRANFSNRFVFTAPPVAVSSPNAPFGTSLDFSDLQALATSDTTGNLLVDELNRRMMHSTMSANMKSTILTAVIAYPSVTATDFLNRTQQAIYLVTTSSQYQVQR